MKKVRQISFALLALLLTAGCRIDMHIQPYYRLLSKNGFGVMQDYSAQVAPRDRWAIAAYIRALQLSQGATSADVPAGQKVPSPAPEYRDIGTGATLPVAASKPPAGEAPATEPKEEQK